MKMPPKSHRVRRLVYRFARFFFPEPMDGCNPLSDVERRAAFYLRSGRHRALQEGQEHYAGLGVFQAGETLRAHNSALNFDRHAAQRVRPVIQPRLKFKTERK